MLTHGVQDVMLENMTHEEFQLAIRPKIQGSWNLHELLPKDLDHFIMLSSATGVLGNRAQANYAAGNTFQDALAHFRRQQGLAATTIDVGAVLDVGYVADHADRLAMTKYLGSMMKVLREEELRCLLVLVASLAWAAAASAAFFLVRRAIEDLVNDSR